jgi:PAS domain-containing protein
MTTSEIGTLFLDPELRIRFFTPPITAVFNVIETDMGRPIGDITTTVKYANLSSDAKEVLMTLAKKETEVHTAEGKWFAVKMLPYRTTENVIDGVVITFTDVTKIKQAQEHLAISRVALAAFIESATDGMMLFDQEGNLIELNSIALEFFPHGIRKEDATGESIARVLDLIGQGERAEDYYATLKTGIPFIDGERRRHPRIAGRYFSTRAFRTGGGLGVILTDETIQIEFQKADKTRHYAERIVESVREPMVVLDSGLRVVSANAAFLSWFALKPGETLGLRIHELGNGRWDIPELKNGLEKTLTSGSVFKDLVVEQDMPGIGRRTLVLNGRRLKIAKGEPMMLLLAIEDITDDANRRQAVAEPPGDV